MTFPLELQSQK